MHECRECNYSTPKISNFQRHMAVHQKTFSGNFKCSQCNYRSTSKQNVTKHFASRHSLVLIEEARNSHSESTPDQLPDPYLKPQEHTDPDTEEKIVFEDSFQCSVCEYKSHKKQNVIRHQYLKHPSEDDGTKESEHIAVPTSNLEPDPHPEIMFLPSFQCSLCSYWSTKKQNVVRHLSTKHDGNGTVITQAKTIPDPQLPSYSKLSVSPNPQNKIIFEEMFQCSVCDYRSTDKQNVMAHQSQTHGSLDDRATVPEERQATNSHPELSFMENFQCSLCDYQSTKKQNVKRHLTLIHGSEGFVVTGPDRKVVSNPYQEIMFVANFPCNQCTYSSTKKQNLIRHQMLIHGITKDGKKKSTPSMASNLFPNSSDDSRSNPLKAQVKEDEEDESVPAKRLLLAECGLIWHTNEFPKTEES